MKLTNPTDDELNHVFAEKVAGSRCVCDGMMRLLDVKCGDQAFEEWRRIPEWTESADLVIPWLEKCATAHVKWSIASKLWTVHCSDRIYPYYMDESFPRTAVLALLRAHGVEVEFTKWKQ